MMYTVEDMMKMKELGFTNEQITMMVSGKGKKSKVGTGAEAPKEFKVHYDHFELNGKGWEATSVASKAGNPDALLTVTFEERPEDKVTSRLKAGGFRWDNANSRWYAKNGKWEQHILAGLDLE